ncbi:carbonic anhydrase [Aspergillus saccharolyticus JOP 1030-1]|uniref:Carbonic anhydrase n=1 Tax=Aspergillus saccharolyticus JOP 1030-1 TaxID=1450539 RepID=A0A318ZFP9_9EURO|nr:carbonic anhydrase [Aspergillus saccharolyticus JOP 1030-1]PYH45895.1 carbonic anhydrase [Aspergillus saccharolyticus JOP 1030-1]
MRFLLILPLVTAATACLHDRTLARRAAQAGTPSFGYSGAQGPLNWYGLDPQTNAACDLGKQQSPIAIDSTTIRPIDPGSVSFDIPSAEHVEFENLGYTLEVILPNGTLTVQDKQYTLAQFHFHTPSEHRIDEEHFPLEVHFVWTDETHGIAVVGFVFQLSDAGDCDSLFNSVFAHVESISEPGSATEIESLVFDGLAKHFESHDVFTYGGSLTTPPCSEGVSWFVSAEPLALDVHSYNQVKRVIRFNSRYTQNVPGDENLLEMAARELNGL